MPKIDRRQPIFTESIVYFEHAEIIVVRMGETLSTCILSLNSQIIASAIKIYGVRSDCWRTLYLYIFPLHFSNVKTQHISFLFDLIRCGHLIYKV